MKSKPSKQNTNQLAAWADVIAAQGQGRRIKIWDVFEHTNWGLLAEQKQALCEAVGTHNETALDGLLNWIDAVQDAAADAGYPVVWLEEDDETDI